MKASSALTVAKQIVNKIKDECETILINELPVAAVSVENIDKLASELADERGYPRALSRLLVRKK